LKNEAEFTWGADQQRAFDNIKTYLSSPPVLKAPMAGILFRLYIAVEDVVIEAILTQIIEGKKHIITYLSQRLIDVKQDILLLKSCVYISSMLAPNYNVIGYLVLV
jgi:hypothetical protein